MLERGSRASAPISAVAVFISLLLAVGALAALAPSVSQLLSGVREGLRERGERGAELIRIYIHSTDETELGAPIITVVSAHHADSFLTDYVVVARDGSVMAAGKLGDTLAGIRLPPGGRLRLDPRSLGLSYATFAELADAVKAIYIRTSEGNSFGSSYGPPPSENIRVEQSFSTSREARILVPSFSTSVSYSFPTNFPRLGEALVVRNVIFVDRNGYVRGGAFNGRTWSDGSFDPSRVPATPSGTDRVPLNGYYLVPDWHNLGDCHTLYRSKDTCPAFIEMVEMHPAEHFAPEGSAVATAYYMRFAGETQLVWNAAEGRTYTVTAQRPVKFHAYPHEIPGTYTATIPATYTSYKATVGRTSEATRTRTTTLTSLVTSPTATRTISTTTTTCTTLGGSVGGQIQCRMTTVPAYTTTLYTTITSVRESKTTYYSSWTTILRTGSTFTTTVTMPVTVQPDGGLVQAAPVFDPLPAYDRWSQSCGVYFGPSGGTKTCGFTINPPSGPLKLIAIKEVGYTVSTGTWGYCTELNRPGVGIDYVKVTGPWGTFTTKSGSWSMSGLPAGSVSFELQASMGACYPDWHGEAVISAWVVYEFFWREVTAAATVATSGGIRDWISQAVNGSSLSGDAVARLAGTVQPGQVIKVEAPIILLNYIYFIKTDPTDLPPPPSPRTGGRGGAGSMRMECEVEEIIRPADGGGGGGGNMIVPGVYGDITPYVVDHLARCRPL